MRMASEDVTVTPGPPAAEVVEVWTDGGCKPNPGPGGWAAILRFGNAEKELSGAERATTNNRMELTAAAEAIEQPLKIEMQAVDDAKLMAAESKGRFIHENIKGKFEHVKSEYQAPQ